MQKVLDFDPSVLNVRRPKPAANQPQNADHIPLPIESKLFLDKYYLKALITMLNSIDIRSLSFKYK